MRQDAKRYYSREAIVCLLALLALTCWAAPEAHAATSSGLHLDAKGVPTMSDTWATPDGKEDGAEARSTQTEPPPYVKVTSGIIKLAFNKRAKSFNENVDSFSFKGAINPGDILINGLTLDEFGNERASICVSLEGEPIYEFELGLPSKVRGTKVIWSSNFPSKGGVNFTLDTLSGAFSVSGKKLDLADSDSIYNRPPVTAKSARGVNPDTNPDALLVIKMGTPDINGDYPFEGNAQLVGLYKLKRTDAVGTWTYKYGRTPYQPVGGIFHIEKMTIEQQPYKGDALFPVEVGRGDPNTPDYQVRARIWACLRGPEPGDIDPSGFGIQSQARLGSFVDLQIGDFNETIDGADFVPSGINFNYVNDDPTLFRIAKMTFDNKKWKFYAETTWVPLDEDAFLVGAAPRLPVFEGFGEAPIVDKRTDPRRNLFIPVILNAEGNRYAFPALLGRKGTSWVLQGKSALSPAPDQDTINDVASDITNP